LDNLLAKLAVVLAYFICATNVGLYAAKLYRKPFWLDSAFAVAIAFDALFGILVIPNPKYLLGLIAFAAMYGIYSLEYALQQSPARRHLAWIEHVMRVTTNVTPQR
jgi:hypothetical protein